MIEFIDQGGNVLLVGDSKISEQQRDFAYEFAVDFDRNKVQDYFNHGPADSIFSDNLVAPKSVISSLKGPILYDGIAHTITGKNPLGINVLAASDSAFNSQDPKLPIGASLSLVSALQALNNARVVFAGSVLMFSNQYLQASVDYNGVKSKTGNKDFVRQISEWVFQEKSVLKLDGHRHHRQGELKQHGIYTINDDLVPVINGRYTKLRFPKKRIRNGNRTWRKTSSLKR